MAQIKVEHFLWELDDEGVAIVTLNRPEKKNPLTFESYAELRDTFRFTHLLTRKIQNSKETNDELELHGKAAIRDKLMANRTYNEKPESKEI